MIRLLAALVGASILGATALAQSAATPQGQPAASPGACPCGMAGMAGGHHGVCGDLTANADVVVQNTADGAVIHFRAKAPANVAEVQQDAANMGACMGGHSCASVAPSK